MTYLKVFFPKSLTLERKLSDVAHTIVQVSTCESQLLEIERVLFLTFFFHKR